ncbi:MAG: hypothetical protein J6B89_04880 [Bacilli bacterium]|nr:hypothetical protein [Bacilli bacterium]
MNTSLNRSKIYRNIAISLVLIFVFFGAFLFAKNLNQSYAINTSNIPTELADEFVSFSGDYYGETDGTGIPGISITPYYGNPVDDKSITYDFFCLNMNKEWADDYTFIPTASSKLPYAYVVLSTYNVPGYNYDANLERYLRQIAIWLYQYEQAGSPTNDTDPNYISSEQLTSIRNSKYYPYLTSLIDAAKSMKDPLENPPKVAINYDGNWTINGDNLITSSISINGSGLNYYNVSLPSSISSAKIIVDGSPISAGTKIDISKSFKIQIPINDIKINNIDFSISIDSQYEMFEAHKIVPQSGQSSYELIQDILTFIRTTNTTQTSIKLTIPTGNIKVAKIETGKTSVDGNNLEGAGLCITKSTESDCKNAIYTFTSTKSISNFTLVPGSYKVIEKTAPSGYLPSNQTYNFTIDEKGNASTTEIIIENTPTKVTLNKISKSNNNPISGAEIDIYKIDSESNTRTFINTITSVDNPNGIEVTNQDGSPLSFGNYVAIERKAPNGYFLDDNEHTFTLSKDKTNANIVINNSPNSLEIIKKDQKGNDLPGATFIINKDRENANNNIYDTCISGSSTKPCTFSMIPFGTYYIHETKAPDGYLKSNEVKEVVINAQTKETQTFTYTNIKKGITILKTDKAGNPLSGAELVLNTSSDICTKNSCIPYNNDSKYKWTSSNSPKDISNLPTGRYYIHEISAPDGYVLDTKPKEIEILPTDVTKSFTFSNELVSLSIEKLDKSGNPVSGAELAIYKAPYTTSSIPVDKWTSDGTPHNISNLKFGEYVLVELKPASGYYASNTSSKFTIDENTKNKQIKIYNEKKNITVLKVDKEQNPISGATLALFNADTDTQIGSSWITTNKEYTLNNLSNGNYYIKELKAPDGYITSSKKEIFTIDDNTTSKKVTFENDKIILRLAKVDASTGKNIAGATMRLSKTDGSIDPITFVSTESDYEVDGPNNKITPGTYILEELNSPTGYITSDSKIEFEVYSTGKVQTRKIISNNITISINNKKLIIDSNKISGFKFILVNNTTGEVIDNISLDHEGYTSNLLPNGEYYLEETDVPEGYILNTNKLNFFITDNTDNKVIKFSNDYTKVVISKKDITNGEEIPGAHLQLKDSDGKVIEEWISTTEGHLIEKILEAGKTYYLKETIAPSGYELSSSEVVFTMDHSGVVKMVAMNNTPYVNPPDTAKSRDSILYIIGITIIALGLYLIIPFTRKNYRTKA